MTRAAEQGLPYAQAQLRDMENHIPAADRARGTQLAARMAGEAPASAPPAAPARVRTSPPSPAVSAPPRIAATDLPPSTAANPPPPRPDPVRTTPPDRAPVRAAPATAPATPVRATGRWRVQLGAFGDEANARRAWNAVSGRLEGLQPYYVRAGALTRLQAGPFPTRAAAERACASLRGQACFAVSS